METAIKSRLVFVYNADSGRTNAFFDSLHKVFSPSTYNCNLCDITYGIFSENAKWKKFRKESDTAMEFLHKDEFDAQYASKFGHKFTFPIVLVENGDGFEVLLSTPEINTLKTVEELIQKIEERL